MVRPRLRCLTKHRLHQEDTSQPTTHRQTPAPVPSGGSSLTVFDGTNANGTWSLYVYDAFNLDGGQINGGWSITFNSAAGCGTPDLPPTPATPSNTPTITLTPTITNTPAPTATCDPGA